MKKFFTLLYVLILLFAVVACSGTREPIDEEALQNNLQAAFGDAFFDFELSELVGADGAPRHIIRINFHIDILPVEEFQVTAIEAASIVRNILSGAEYNNPMLSIIFQNNYTFFWAFNSGYASDFQTGALIDYTQDLRDPYIRINVNVNDIQAIINENS